MPILKDYSDYSVWHLSWSQSNEIAGEHKLNYFVLSKAEMQYYGKFWQHISSENLIYALWTEGPSSHTEVVTRPYVLCVTEN